VTLFLLVVVMGETRRDMDVQKVCHIANLIYNYLQGSITGEEMLMLDAWRRESLENERLFEVFCHRAFIDRKQVEECLCDDFAAYQKVITRKKRFIRRRRYQRVGICVVAAMVTGILVTMLFPFTPTDEWNNNGGECPIVAGSSKATLVLADGSCLALTDSIMQDTLVLDDGNQIVRQGGKVLYRGTEKEQELSYNSLKVPRGGSYVVTLGDGTVAYLNSVSELRYPVQFAGNERRVCLSGEAYFEVARDSTRPFYVEVNDLEIRVYGTEFNVNAHAKEKIQTVLVNGQIGLRVKSGEEYMLLPSQLAEYDIAENKVEIRQVNTRLYTAWQEGWFLFEDERLEDVLEQLSLWYDVDVVYQSHQARELRIFGSMKHYDSIEVILRAIEMSVKVRFKIDGKTIIVSE